MKPYQFFKSGQGLYIDLPEFLEQGGSISDLQMVDGANRMLNMVTGNKTSVNVYIARE